MTIALRIDPEDQTVDPGLQAVFTIHVVNQSGIVDRVALDVLGSAGPWSRVDPQAVALFPGTDATAVLVVTPPLGTALGPVPLGIRAVAETSGFVEVGEANLNVGASRTVEAELRPRTVTGKRRATSVVFLHNLGNAPTKVQVVATDPDDAIVFDAPQGVQLGPGVTTEVPLRMRLPSREKQGATLPYSVLVEGGDTGQSLDGQVRQPAKKRWPIMAAMMALALLAAAFMFLKPEDSVAITEGQADETTTTTALGETTTVPPAATTTVAPGAAAPADPAAGGGAAPAGAAPGAPAPGGGGGAAAPGTTRPPGAGPTAPPVVATPPPPTVAPTCPGVKGTAKQTAQRVVCAWEAGRLHAEIGQTVTQAAVTALGNNPSKGQVAGAVLGAQVTFGCNAPGKGVRAVTVNGAGLVDLPIQKCP